MFGSCGSSTALTIGMSPYLLPQRRLENSTFSRTSLSDEIEDTVKTPHDGEEDNATSD